jgi:hypothetical protein
MRATTTASARATITLAIHPRFGEEFVVRWSYGTGSVRLETAQGRQLIVPLEWTDLRPRVLQTLHAGRTVHLEPVALQELARWVEARAAARGHKKLGHFDKCEQSLRPDGEQRRSETRTTSKRQNAVADGESGRHRSTAAVVEQAGAPDDARRRRGGHPRKRGT